MIQKSFFTGFKYIPQKIFTINQFDPMKKLFLWCIRIQIQLKVFVLIRIHINPKGIWVNTP